MSEKPPNHCAEVPKHSREIKTVVPKDRSTLNSKSCCAETPKVYQGVKSLCQVPKYTRGGAVVPKKAGLPVPK